MKIPETVTYNGVTFTVTKIADGAFANCTSLEEIIIPGTVVEVGTTFDAHYRSGYGESKYVYDSLPFYNCTALKKVKFEDGTLPIQLGVAWVDDRYYPSDTKGLFYYSPLEEVYIGRNITYKDKSDYYSFTKYPQYYGYSAFYNQPNLTKVTISSTVTEIPAYLFYKDASLTTINVGTQLSKILNHAFDGCNLRVISLPNSLESIGDYAFNGCVNLCVTS